MLNNPYINYVYVYTYAETLARQATKKTPVSDSILTV